MEKSRQAGSINLEPNEPQFEPNFWQPEELELFEQARKHEEFIKNPIWKRLKEAMDSFVSDAEAEMRANRSPKPEDAFHLQLYWREREHIRDVMVAMIYAPIRDRDSILEDLKAQQKSKEALIYARRDSQAD